MPIFLINLDERTDRLIDSQSEIKRAHLNFTRVEAISISELSFRDLYLAPGVLACYLSHLKALRLFLEGKSEHAIILEDDFEISLIKHFTKIILAEKPSFDFLQLGFLGSSPSLRLEILIKNSWAFILKVLSSCAERNIPYLSERVSRKLTVREYLGLGRGIVLNNIMPGAHAYLVSRKFAEEIIGLSEKPFLAIDNLYMALGDMKTYKMARLKKSIISQRTSPTSIRERYIRSI